ncbi:unnamed protein product [Rotaria sordida]|uniref:Ubiquitin carboxyl-terminal hydrolase 36 n=1 Tax=Rotaria sordida TaxID=392033 RepID=A0A818PXL5_9BILA|nr:unnamed protein product [Rotaria sordida]
MYVSRSSSPHKSPADNDPNSGNISVTDTDIHELENLVPYPRQAPTEYEQHLKEACQQLLRHPCGIISTLSLAKKIDTTAANLLVEQCLLLYTDDLFAAHTQLDPEGYIKYIPNNIDITFIGSLLHYDIDPTLYFQEINIPELWKSYLSTNGIAILRSMTFYEIIIDVPPSLELPADDVERIDGNNNYQKKNLSFKVYAQSSNDPSENYHQTHHHRDFTNKFNVSLSNTNENFNNSTKKRITSAIDKSESDTFEIVPSGKRFRPETNDYQFIQSNYSNVIISKPTMNWRFLRKRIIGLKNTDNTCYINAALQCLASTPPFVEWLFDQLDTLDTCQLSNQGKFCSVCELTKVISSIHPSPRKKSIESDCLTIPSANSIRTHINLISSVFNVGEQEDASEFIITLLDHCIGCLSSHSSISHIISSGPTIIDQIFNIKLLSSGECPVCLYTFKREEITNMLLVEIDKLNHLTDALAHFVERESINTFICSNCDKSVKLDKRITINELSSILIINFKRCSTTFNTTKKLLHQVNYNELLDISPYMTSNLLSSTDKTQNIDSSNNYYKLYATINHASDDLANGHYYAYIRSLDNLWFLVNDAHCQNVSLNEVLNHREALILFYAKVVHTPTPIDRMLQQIPQPLMSSSTENNIVLSSSILSSSIPGNSTSINESITFLNEQLSKTKSLITMKTPMRSYDSKSQNDIELKLENSLSIIKSRKSAILNKTPIPGQTRSSIKIGNQCSNNQIEENRKNIDHILNEEIPSQSMPSKKLLFVPNETSNDSIAEVSDDEETKKKTCIKLASVATGIPIEQVFEQTLSQKYSFRLNETDLLKMNQRRHEELKKKYDRKMKMIGLLSDISSLIKKKWKNRDISTTINDTNAADCHEKTKHMKTSNKVNIEYLNILLPHLKHYNAACALCICTRYFGKNISKSTDLLVRCTLKCSGRVCKFKCNVHVLNNGYCFLIALNRNVFHRVNERISRPIRGSRRRAIMDKFKGGSSVYRIHAQYDEQRTAREKQGFNYDATGKSKKIFKKIKAEANAESLLSPNISLGILQLHDKLVDEINNDGIIKGGIQIVQFRPFCVVAFTEASIRLYDAIVNHPDSVLSWDATGGIVKNSSSKQCLYYELTISHPNIVNEDSLVPLTFMLSESQTLFTIIQWLSAFKESYRKVFPHKKDSFAVPAIILSDRAQIFLQAALHVFNNENYDAFLARAYRIVTNTAVRNDLSKTNIHACLSHFMLDMRKRVNKYLLEDMREVAMWSIALLVNSSTWPEIKENWTLICQVFLSYSTNNDINFKQHHATLLVRISKITSDPNSSRAISQSKDILSNRNDSFEFDDTSEIDDYDDNQMHTNEKTKTNNKKKRLIISTVHSSNHNKSIIDEEEELNKADSPFKRELQAIYNKCLEACIKNYGNLSSSDKAVKGIRQWLSFINQRCIPTIPIWSNLLLGNLSRHGTSAIRAYDNLLLSSHDQRTNAISERRMSIVKRTQLGIETRIRSDIVLDILINDMQKMVEKFSISLMGTIFQDTGGETNSQQLKVVQERWRQSNRRGHGHYAKTPETSIMNNLKNALIISSSNINDRIILPQLSVSNWLNISIGLLLSMKIIRETPPSSPMKTPLLIDILSFIKNWISASNRLKPPKKTSVELTTLLNTQFHIPINFPTDVNEQLSFIIHNILLPIISYSISVNKIYRCTSCKHTINVRFNINYIEISMVENQFRLNQQLANYFANNSSDHICDKCSMLMSRQIKISDCPPIIILKINDTKNSTNLLSKPPHTVCFYPFMDDSCIGCSSSSVFDIVAFLSVIPDTQNKLLDTNIENVDNENSNLQCTPTISTSQQITTSITSSSVLLNQPVPVRLLDKSTNKLTIGSIRSLTIIPK